MLKLGVVSISKCVKKQVGAKLQADLFASFCKCLASTCHHLVHSRGFLINSSLNQCLGALSVWCDLKQPFGGRPQIGGKGGAMACSGLRLPKLVSTNQSWCWRASNWPNMGLPMFYLPLMLKMVAMSWGCPALWASAQSVASFSQSVCLGKSLQHF